VDGHCRSRGEIKTFVKNFIRLWTELSLSRQGLVASLFLENCNEILGLVKCGEVFG
jgi:hypothetical protein